MTQPSATQDTKKAAPAPPKLSQQLAWALAEAREKPADGSDPLEERGAALFLAHVILEIGRDKALKLSKGDVGKALDLFKKTYPMVGQALVLGDVVRFVWIKGDANRVEHDYHRLMFELLR